MMTVKIAIIGLGQIGASIGLALASHKDQVTTIGFDTSQEVARKAHKLQVVESLAHNLASATSNADVIILALPIDQIHDVLKEIAGHIRSGAVVFDTAPGKQAASSWAEEFLPNTCPYIGLLPAINPDCLDENKFGIEAARADLFHKSVMAVSAPHTVGEGAIQLATSFATLLGARAYFADLAEVDGIMAAVSNLPTLASAALTETVIGQPGWADIRKLAGKTFASALHPLDVDDWASLSEAAIQNRENTVRLLDEYIASLRLLRDELAVSGKKTLGKHLERIINARAQWQRVRADGDWQNIEFVEQSVPTFSELWMQQLGLGKLIGLRRKKKDEE